MNTSWSEQIHLYLTAKIVPRLIIAAILFIGGIIILNTSLTGWNLFLGIPATQIGLVLLIFTFDAAAKGVNEPKNLHLTYCPLCRKPTIAPVGQTESICPRCQKTILKQVQLQRQSLHPRHSFN